MPISKAQHEERVARRQAAAEHANRGLVLVQRADWFGIYSTEYGDLELISRDEATAQKALTARRQDDPFWRDV